MAWYADVRELEQLMNELPVDLGRMVGSAANECDFPDSMRKSDIIVLIDEALEDPRQPFRLEYYGAIDPHLDNLDDLRREGKRNIIQMLLPEDVSEDRLDLMLQAFTNTELCDIYKKLFKEWFLY